MFSLSLWGILNTTRESLTRERAVVLIMNAISPLVTRELGIDIRNVSFFSSLYLQVLFTWKNRGDERG